MASTTALKFNPKDPVMIPPQAQKREQFKQNTQDKDASDTSLDKKPRKTLFKSIKSHLPLHHSSKSKESKKHDKSIDKPNLRRTSLPKTDKKKKEQPKKLDKRSTSISLGEQSRKEVKDYLAHNHNHLRKVSSKPAVLPKLSSTPKLGTHGRTLSLESTNGVKKVGLGKIADLEYNPYGIFNKTKIIDSRQMFKMGNNVEEEDIRLPHPTLDPNEYLPEQLKEPIQTLDEKYGVFVDSHNDYLGSGGAAAVKKIYLKGDRKKLYALKKFSVFRKEHPDTYYKRISEEYVFTKNMKHLHMIKCHELLKLPIQLQRSWGMVMELYPADLMSVIKKRSYSNVNTAERLCFFKQIALGLKYMHEQDIVYLDLKPENVLLTESGIVKIADFGCCSFGHTNPGDFKSQVKFSKKLLGTPPYQPPEVAVLKNLSMIERTAYDPFKFDYWSLGMILFALIWGKIPFNEAKSTDKGYLLYKNEHEFFCELCPKFNHGDASKVPVIGTFAQGFPIARCTRLAWKLCHPDPKYRMTLPELFKDKYFQEIKMCINESQYECNFFHYEEYKDRQYEVPFASEDIELIDIRRSMKNSSSLRGSSVQKSISRQPSSSGLVSPQHSQQRRDSISQQQKQQLLLNSTASPTHAYTSTTAVYQRRESLFTTSNDLSPLDSGNTVKRSNSDSQFSWDSEEGARSSSDISSLEASHNNINSRNASGTSDDLAVDASNKQLETLGESSEEDDSSIGVTDNSTNDETSSGLVINIKKSDTATAITDTYILSKVEIFRTDGLFNSSVADGSAKQDEQNGDLDGSTTLKFDSHTTVEKDDSNHGNISPTASVDALVPQAIAKEESRDELFMNCRSFVTRQGDVIDYNFSQDDFSEENKDTEYMLVPLEDVSKALNFEIIAHNHASSVSSSA